MCGQNFGCARWQFVMEPHGGWIKLAQRNWITQVVKEEARLVGDAIERKCFDPQAGFFRRAVTSRFGGAQFDITP
jgi:hypothetical protein